MLNKIQKRSIIQVFVLAGFVAMILACISNDVTKRVPQPADQGDRAQIEVPDSAETPVNAFDMAYEKH